MLGGIAARLSLKYAPKAQEDILGARGINIAHLASDISSWAFGWPSLASSPAVVVDAAQKSRGVDLPTYHQRYPA